MDIGSNIRFYRTEMGLTQEALAELLSVSHQTVSKWERQILLPDITVLPKMAAIFHVSIDNLLNFNIGETRKYLFEVKQTLSELNRIGDLEAQKALLEEAMQKYPHEAYFAERLLNVCIPLAAKGVLSEEEFLRLRAIGNRALGMETDRWLSDSILRALSLLCSKFEKYHSEAFFYYKRLPDIRHLGSNIAHLIGVGEEYQKQTEKALLDHLYYAAYRCRNLAQHTASEAEKTEKLLASNRIIENIFKDENYGVYSSILVMNYYDLSLLSLPYDVDHFFDYAEKCLMIAAGYNRFLKGYYQFIFGQIAYDKSIYYDKTDYFSKYKEKYLSDERIISLREHGRFSVVFNDSAETFLPKTPIDRKNGE